MTPVEVERQGRIEYLELVLCEPYWYTKVELILEYYDLKKVHLGQWTIEKTAHSLGRSIPSLNNDLWLARQLIKYPDLKRFETRRDAEQSARGRS